MGKMIALTPEEQAAAIAFSKMIKAIMKAENISVQRMAAITSLNELTVYKIRKCQTTMQAMIKVADSMGYTLTLVKTKNAKKVSDDLKAITRLKTLKQYRRKKDGKTTTRHRRKKATVQREKRATQRELEQRQQHGRDIFSID